MRVAGESMNRELPNGCYALITPGSRVEESGVLYAVSINGRAAAIRRVRRLDNGLELLPSSTDPTFKPVLYDFSDPDTPDIAVVGRVIWYCIPADWDFAPKL